MKISKESIFCHAVNLGLYNNMPDRKFIEKQYMLRTKTHLDLDNPKTYNEKLQWIKLYDRNPIYTVMVDKIKAKEYVGKLIGYQYIVPLIDTWESVEEIDFDKLPEQFVIKCNHNSGKGMYICTKKEEMCEKKVRKQLRRGLKENYFYNFREWPYKNVPKRILAEQYLSDETQQEIMDYKVLCFEGQAKLIEVIMNRHSNPTQDFYDREWVKTKLVKEDFKPSTVQISPPDCLEKMLEFSERLSRGTHHLRVDWYYVNQQLYFGEMTFFDGAGYEEFFPKKYNEILGEWIKLPCDKNY